MLDRPPPSRPLPRHPWRLALLAVALITANMLLQSLIFGLTGELYLTVGLAAVATLLLAQAAAGLLGRTLGGLVLLTPTPPVAVGLAAVAALGALLPVSLLTGWSTTLKPPSAEWLAFLNAQLPAPGWPTAAAFLCVTAAAPLAEEIIFRGLLYRALRGVWSPWPAALLSALLFALSHGEPWALFGLLALGLLYARLTEATGSLLPAVAAHAVHNALSFGLLLRRGGMHLPDADADVPYAGLALSALLLAAAWVGFRRRRSFKKNPG